MSSDPTDTPGKDDVYRIMELFIESAKNYTQLSTGALLLTVVFSRTVLGIGEDGPLPINGLLVATWVCFLFAAISGASYQYLAVRYIESKVKSEIRHSFDWPPFVIQNPWVPYGSMLLSFYLGALVFTLMAIQNMS